MTAAPPSSPIPQGSKLLKVIQALVVKFETHLPFGINNWPTWSNEGLGGILEQAVFLLPAIYLSWWPLAGFALYNAASVYYEEKIDPYGFSLPDVAWRLAGSVVATTLALVI